MTDRNLLLLLLIAGVLLLCVEVFVPGGILGTIGIALMIWAVVEGYRSFGPEIGIKKTSAQVTAHYTPETLVGRQVAAVVNFPPRQIGKFMSEVLALGFSDEAGGIVLIAPDKTVPNGGRMH